MTNELPADPPSNRMSMESSLRFETPPEVSELLARYRALLDERGCDWGDDQVDLFRWGRFWPDAAVGSSAFLSKVFAAVSEAAGDWPKAVSKIVGPGPPAGTVLVRVTDAGLEVTTGPSRPGIARGTVPIDVVIDSLIASDATVTVDDRTVTVAAGGAALEMIEVDGGAAGFRVGLGGESVAVTEAIRSVAGAQLRLSSPRCTRWSVTDASGGAWFPQGVLHKWDVHHRPFFHGADLHLEIPAEPLTVACTRGIEHERIVRRITPGDGESISIECDPQPLFDPRAEGWYGGDLHIHMNYGGDLVCELHDAARMQLGEGLDLANFVAANCQTSLVYDTTTLAHYVGHNLPWSSEETIASMGAEYRNDLLGHVVAFAPDNVPSQLYSG